MKTTKILIGLLLLGATSLFAADGAGLFKACTGCHGANGEKSALGKSQIINTWDAAKIEASLKGYKDGSYGGDMRGVMKGQVARLSNEDIKTISAHISSLK